MVIQREHFRSLFYVANLWPIVPAAYMSRRRAQHLAFLSRAPSPASLTNLFSAIDAVRVQGVGGRRQYQNLRRTLAKMARCGLVTYQRSPFHGAGTYAIAPGGWAALATAQLKL
jgi:hypothetical protein